MRHADDEVNNRKSHEHDFEVLITQKRDKKLKETLSLLKHPIRLGFYAVLNCDVDLVNRRCANFPVVHRICHFQALLLGDYASVLSRLELFLLALMIGILHSLVLNVHMKFFFFLFTILRVSC